MKDKIIVSDFDGTITKEDTLSKFLEINADKEWLVWEDKWLNGEVGSADCLRKQFELIPNLSAELIDEFLGTVEIDNYFEKFNNIRAKNDIDFIIVSDGLDYFIYKILQKCNIFNVKVISNHAEFIDDKFVMSFPNRIFSCCKDSGTCKCSVVNKLRKEYNTIFYVGDGASDQCVADKVDFLFAKSTLLEYCLKRDIDYIEYNNYKEVVNYDRLGFNF